MNRSLVQALRMELQTTIADATFTEQLILVAASLVLEDVGRKLNLCELDQSSNHYTVA